MKIELIYASSCNVSILKDDVFLTNCHIDDLNEFLYGFLICLNSLSDDLIAFICRDSISPIGIRSRLVEALDLSDFSLDFQVFNTEV